MPRQYWRNERASILERAPEDECFEDQPLEEYTQLCYLVKLNE